MSYPTLTEIENTVQDLENFYGYDHEPKIAEGYFYDTKNLTSDYLPMLASRERRGIMRTGIRPGGLLGKAQLAWVDGTRLYYGGQDVTGNLPEPLIAGDHELISMGAYIIILPEKLYFNTENSGDSGYIENTVNATGVTLSVTLQDGTPISYTTGSSAPESPASGEYWLDTGSTPHALKVWSESESEWSSVATVYVKLAATGIGLGFAEDDGVTIEGLASDNDALQAQLDDLNGSQIIQAWNKDWIVIIGLLDSTLENRVCTISRTMPAMDYICEAQNRLWGCYYGLSEDGTETLNEIYCCALGDFKNWRRYAGISTDSYTASVGTDGKWTGAINYLGYPLFFKEHHLHKVYISTSGAHQIVDTECRGVQDGCSRSLAIVDEQLFYKSRDGIMVYDGSLPQSTGNALGRELYYDAVGGSCAGKYYVSMRNVSDAWSLFVLDVSAGIWMREDDTQAAYMARCGDGLYILTAGGELLDERGTDIDADEKEDPVSWYAETGIIGYSAVGAKQVSRFNIRMKLPYPSVADVYIEYDSDGIWHSCGHIAGNGLRTFLLPVRPRRCDHFRIRMEGTGEVKVYSFSKVYETGSDC